MTSRHCRLLALCIVAGACLPQAKADVVAEFYQGRTVTVVVGSNAAGGYDTFARAVARYMGKHIPGSPTLIVRNMPGAGGMTAANFLYNNADKDGSVIGLVQNNTPFEPLFGTKEARYDPVRFNWLGSPSAETAMVLLWHAAPVNSVAELKVREVAVGVSGANSTPAFFTRLLNATLGTRMKPINGYPGQNDVLLAMERREIDGHPSAFFSSVRSTRPTWLRDKTAKAIVQYGAENGMISMTGRAGQTCVLEACACAGAGANGASAAPIRNERRANMDMTSRWSHLPYIRPSKRWPQPQIVNRPGGHRAAWRVDRGRNLLQGADEISCAPPRAVCMIRTKGSSCHEN